MKDVKSNSDICKQCPHLALYPDGYFACTIGPNDLSNGKKLAISPFLIHRNSFWEMDTIIFTDTCLELFKRMADGFKPPNRCTFLLEHKFLKENAK